MSNREATQEFAIRNVLVGRCGEKLTPDTIERIVREIMQEVTKGSTNWAFSEEKET